MVFSVWPPCRAGPSGGGRRGREAQESEPDAFHPDTAGLVALNATPVAAAYWMKGTLQVDPVWGGRGGGDEGVMAGGEALAWMPPARRCTVLPRLTSNITS